MEIGFLRWLNDREKLTLCFKKLPFEQIVDRENRKINSDFLIKFSKENKRKPSNSIISTKKIKEKTDELSKRKANPAHVCQGHDLVSLLTFAIPIVFNDMFDNQDTRTNKRKLKFSDKKLSSNLRVAYDSSFFQSTQLYTSIRKWEKENSPYKVLSR